MNPFDLFTVLNALVLLISAYGAAEDARLGVKYLAPPAVEQPADVGALGDPD